MADCSAAGTTIDRVARAVIGGATSNGVTSNHVGALFGHASMYPATAGGVAAANVCMPMVSPDHLIMPYNANTTAAAAAAAASTTITQSQVQMNHQYQQRSINTTGLGLLSGPSSAMMMHPASAAQMQHHHQQQHQRQAMIAMHQQQQQQQHQAMMMMQQQQQQQQFQQQQQIRHQQQLETTINQQQKQLQKQSPIEDDWHQGLEKEYVQEAAHGVNMDKDGIEELAAAWAEAEADYDNVLLDHEQQQDRQEQYARDMNNELLDEADYANLWQGNNGDTSLTDQYNSNNNNITRPYEFVNTIDVDATNAAATSNNKNYMEEGMKQFQEGNLKDAIVSFEMELQHHNADNSTAWRMLGNCHAENDQDPEAIQCLEAAVDRDPFCPEALLALGVSYVNELNHERALDNMKAWLTHNPKYAGMDFTNINSSSNYDNTITTEDDDIYGAGASSSVKAATKVDAEATAVDVATESHRNTKESAFNEVKSMLLSALEFNPTDAGDIYEALGVIYNVSKDYDKAVESFRMALEIRPNDYQLWNKLGATLANGSQSDQALPTYHQSLKIKPKYARAWLNMAISHSNLQDHDEAARCYLQTLSLNPDATHCWTYLRMSLSSQERWDLLPLVFERNLSGFQNHFDFVLY